MTPDFSGNHECESDLAALAAHYPTFKRVALRLIHDVHDAEDLTQQTFLRVTEKHDQLQRGTAIKSWGFQILHNECCTVIRTRSRQRQSAWRPCDLDQLHAGCQPASDSGPAFVSLCIEFISQIIRHFPGVPAGVVRVWISERGDYRETARHLLHDQGVDEPSEELIRKKVDYVRMNRKRFCCKVRQAVQNSLPKEPSHRDVLAVMLNTIDTESDSA